MSFKTVVITGVNGFLGGALQAALADLWPKAQVIGLTRNEADLSDRAATRLAFEKLRPDCVFHMAGCTYSNDWSALFNGNIVTTINLLEVVRELGLKTRVVIPGSAAEYGRVADETKPIAETTAPNPLSAYGAIKAAQTSLAQTYAKQGLDVVVGRLFNIFSDSMKKSAITEFAEQLKRIANGAQPPELHVGNLDPTRDYVHLTDVCSAFAALATDGRRGEIYNICSGQSFSMREILKLMIAQTNVNPQLVVDAARSRPADIPYSRGDKRKITADTNWQPKIPLDTAIGALFVD